MAGLDLGALGSSLDSNLKATTKKQRFEREATERKVQLSTVAAKEAAATTQAALDSQAKTREQQLAVYGTMESTIQIAQEAMALSDSNNPLDRLQLWLMQQSDDRYTSEGNTKRLEYLNTAANALSNREIINQTAFRDELLRIQTDLDLELMDDENKLSLLNLTVEQGKELINAHVTGQQVLAGAMSTQAQMQDTALANMTLEQLQVAQQKANAKGEKTVSVGGIEIAAGRLDQRIKDLQQQNFAIEVNKSTMVDQALGNLTDEQLQLKLQEAQNSKDGFTNIGDVRVSTNRILDAQTIRRSQDLTIQGQEMGIQQATRAVTAKLHEDYAAALPLAKLDELIVNGGRSPEMGNVPMDMTMLTRVRAQKAEAQANQLQTEFAVAAAGNPMESVVQHDNWLDQIRTSIAAVSPNSPLLALIDKSKQITAVAGKFVSEGMSGGPEGLSRMLTGLNATTSDRANLEAGIDAEAERLSMGDNQKKLALDYQLRGQQIPPEIIAEGLAHRVNKKLPVSDWLPPRAAGVFTNAFHQAMTDLRAANIQNQLPTSELIPQAMAIALEAATNEISGGMTEELFAMAVNSPVQYKMPLSGIVTPERFLALVARADSNGASIFKENTEATPEQMEAWLSGKEANPELAATQSAQLIIELEKLWPGLGKRYVDWWGSQEAQSLITAYGSAKQQDANSKGFQESVAMGLVLPNLQGYMQSYSQLLQQGFERNVSNQLAADHATFVTFGGNPLNMQVFLLEQDSTLTGVQKQTIMRNLIMPVIQEATAANLSPQETNVMIEQKLRTGTFDNPEMKRLQQLLLKNRDSSIKTLDNFINGQNINQIQSQAFGAWAGFAAGIQNNIFGSPMDRQVTGYDWWREMGQQ